MVVGRKELDKLAGCGCSKCKDGKELKEFYLHSKCHIGSPVWVHYKTGILTIECAVCKQLIAKVVVGNLEDVIVKDVFGGFEVKGM